MKKTSFSALLVIALLGVPGVAQAADDIDFTNNVLFSDSITGPRYYLGFGADNVSSSQGFDPTPYGMIEFASAVQDEVTGLRTRAGAEVSGVGVWGGAGFSIEHVFENSPYYVEASILAGLYTDAGDLDLGVAVEFRSQIMVGYHFQNGYDLAFGLTHKSNAGLGESNPGAETLYLRLGKGY